MNLDPGFLGSPMAGLPLLSRAQTRSICAENPTGEKGKGAMAIPEPGKVPRADLGQGWKISPSITIKPGQMVTLADIAGPGVIQQIWMTPSGAWRHSILRIYWDDAEHPSVECPVGDFFACGWGNMRRWCRWPSA